MQYLVAKDYLTAVRNAECNFKWQRLKTGLYLNHNNKEVRIASRTADLRGVPEGTILWRGEDWRQNDDLDTTLIDLYIEIGKLVLAPNLVLVK